MVVDRNEQVMTMVREELEKNPEVELNALYERARELDPTIGDLSKRQFHARYPLQIKRGKPGSRARRKDAARAPAATGAARRRTPPPSREAIRGVFLDFASDFAQAESRQEIVRVLSNVDEYVGRVEKLLGRRSRAS